MEPMRLLVTDAAAQPPRQATAWLIMTLGRSEPMQSRPHTFPEIKAMLVTLDFVPHDDRAVVQMVYNDLGRMKGVAKHKRALQTCDSFRVWRAEQSVRVEFLDMSQPEAARIRFCMIYELIPPFR